MPDERTISIRIFRVNNFFYGLLSPPMGHDFWAMLSGRPAEQGKSNRPWLSEQVMSMVLWSCQRQGHQTQVIPSKPVRRRHPYLGQPGPPQRPQRRGRVDVRSGPGYFFFHLRGRIRGHPWRADVVLFITRMDGTLFPQHLSKVGLSHMAMLTKDALLFMRMGIRRLLRTFADVGKTS